MELRGWKQIADHLGVTDRTAQNWALLKHMPVHRIPGSKGRVFVHTAEVDSWKLTGPTPIQRPTRKAITVRLPEEQVSNLASLIPAKFPSMQELVSRAITAYAEQMTRKNAGKGGKGGQERTLDAHRSTT